MIRGFFLLFFSFISRYGTLGNKIPALKSQSTVKEAFKKEQKFLFYSLTCRTAYVEPY